ncbi:MAG TPA: excinuclease ABC subunit C [Clostridiales bacterium]|nr:excinuclease ABC subunit C [Clostridiales bacterium]
MFDIKKEVAALPHRPGVYIMKNSSDEIIYVGKAKDLKKRVSQYFINIESKDIKTRKMVPNISEFEYIMTDSEAEALILECNLIKTNKPKYNILLKDDKSYPYIKITLNEKFPRVYYTRNYIKDKSKYFGPYTDVDYMKKLLEVIYKIWKVRTCKIKLDGTLKKNRPCLNYHIGICDAPCSGKTSEEDYNNIIKEVISFLDGKTKGVLEILEENMKDASKNFNFEEATKYRDYISEIKNITSKQKMQDEGSNNQDIIAFFNVGDEWISQVFYMREGKLVGREHYFIKNAELDEESEIENSFLKQYYVETNLIPNEIIIDKEIVDKTELEEFLTQKAGYKVSIIVPQKGRKHKLLQLAKKNAQITLEQFGEKFKKEKDKSEIALKELSELLSIDDKLDRIEAYDISNIQGVYNVASMVVYDNGLKKPSDYRKFKIKSVFGPDDYACMREVIQRRFVNYFKEMKDDKKEYKFNKLPKLILVDGGRGQLNIAERVLKDFELDIPACGVVKDDNHNTRGLYYKNKELLIEKESEIFKLLIRIQDEVHRFTIEYFRQAYTKTELTSELDKVEGIGKIRRIRLIKHFGTLDKIKQATSEELEKVDGMSRKAAESVFKYFNR